MEENWSDDRGSSLAKRFGKVAIESRLPSPEKVLQQSSDNPSREHHSGLTPMMTAFDLESRST